MYYLEFLSASEKHVKWIQEILSRLLCINGYITKPVNSSVYHLKYAKKEALEIILKMYYSPSVVSLSRKKARIINALIVEQQHSTNARVAKLVDAQP